MMPSSLLGARIRENSRIVEGDLELARGHSLASNWNLFDRVRGVLRACEALASDFAAPVVDDSEARRQSAVAGGNEGSAI